MSGPHNPTAFPHVSDIIGHYEGMTLRDYFAGQALAGLAATEGDNSPSYAYFLADAMLAARQKGSTDDQP